MRIRFCILAVLAALAVGLTVWSHGAIYAQREAVDAEQVVLQGDAARAEGVSLEMRTSMDQHLFWETEITAGPEITYHTDYTYSAEARRSTRFYGSQGLWVDVMGNSGVTNGDWETEDQYGMQKPYNDVASRCPAGTTDYTEVVRLRDYYQVYPLYVLNSFDELLPASLEVDRFVIDGELDTPELQLQSLLREFFPIPVPEDVTLEIHVDKDENGEVHGYGGSGLWPFDTCSVVREGGVYFLFSSVAGETPLDTSLFPLGYGVYFLPVELTPTKTIDNYDASTIHFGDPVRVCPVDPAVEYAYLCGGEEGAMYLFTQQGDTLTLTVLDETGAAAQTLPVLENLAEDDRMVNVWLREDFLVVDTASDRFRVVETAGQACRATLEGSLSAIWEEKALDPRYYEPTLDYDGERLAFAGELARNCACFLALYGPEGLEYLGSYYLSLDREVDCYLEDDTPLTVRLP